MARPRQHVLEAEQGLDVSWLTVGGGTVCRGRVVMLAVVCEVADHMVVKE